MSDETTSTDGKPSADASSTAPEAAWPGGEGAATGYSTNQEAATGPETAPRPVGFCQDCGRGLTPETLRTVGTGVFCEPCLEVRLGARQGNAPVGAGTGPGTAPGYSHAQPGTYTALPVVPQGEPNPVLAGLLGLIPGVGAMYNGQFAKGVIHLIIFVILVSLTDDVNGIFGLFVAGWVIYQAFEAYHTAKARLEGLPLPNAFGFNDIGERMGFGKSGPGSASGWNAAPRPPYTAPPPSYAQPSSYPPDSPYAPPLSGVPPATGSDWVGYVPPTAFAGAPPPPSGPSSAAAEPAGRVQASAPLGPAPHAPYHAPYVETYTGAPVAPAARRFPAGAVWLIGLGVLILLANLLPDWRISGRWWPAVLFAGLAVWLFTRRLHSGAGISGRSIACIIRWPAILMVLAILFALHAAYFAVSFGMTCAVLLIAFGALLLLERTLGAEPAPAVPGYAAPVSGYAAPASGNAASAPAYGAPAQSAYSAASDPSRATFTTAGPAADEVVSDEAGKGGQ